jgi:hypothetical protein
MHKTRHELPICQTVNCRQRRECLKCRAVLHCRRIVASAESSLASTQSCERRVGGVGERPAAASSYVPTSGHFRSPPEIVSYAPASRQVPNIYYLVIVYVARHQPRVVAARAAKECTGADVRASSGSPSVAPLAAPLPSSSPGQIRDPSALTATEAIGTSSLSSKSVAPGLDPVSQTRTMLRARSAQGGRNPGRPTHKTSRDLSKTQSPTPASNVPRHVALSL